MSARTTVTAATRERLPDLTGLQRQVAATARRATTRRAPNRWRGFVLGSIGGAAGLLAMDYARQRLAGLIPGQTQAEPAPAPAEPLAAVGAALYQQLAHQAPATPELRQMLGDLARWGVGVVLGGLYGALRAETGLVDLRGGLIWGAGLYDLAGKGLARALDLSPALPERGLPDRALHWGESLAYGLTTAAATQLLARPWRTGLLIALGAAGWTYAQSQRSDPALQTLLGGAERPAEQGHSPVASVPHGGGMKATHTVTVNRPPAEVYRFWRNVENLPRFMDHLERVTVLSDSRSRWRAKAPLGTNVEWEATIINDVADELIAWQSVPGSEIGNAGSVRFTPAPGGRGTEVRVSLSYDPPAGQLGTAIARLLGEEPHAQVAADLRRFKEVMEAGEVPVAGQQPHAHPGA